MQLTQKRVIEIVYKRFNGEVFLITPAMNLKNDLGFDSLDVIELVLILESEFNISISDQEADNIDSIEGIVQLINGKIKH